MALERVGVDCAQGIAIGAPRPLHDELEDELRLLRGDAVEESAIAGDA